MVKKLYSLNIICGNIIILDFVFDTHHLNKINSKWLAYKNNVYSFFFSSGKNFQSDARIPFWVITGVSYLKSRNGALTAN